MQMLTKLFLLDVARTAAAELVLTASALDARLVTPVRCVRVADEKVSCRLCLVH